MNRRTSLFLFSLLLLAVFLGVPVLLIWRAVRHERLDRALITAVRKDDSRTAVRLLTQGADANTRDTGRETFSWRPLLLAIFQGGEKEGDTVLRLAFQNGNEAIARILISHGADVNLPGTGRTLLMDAAGWGDENEIDLLLHAGAHINAHDAAGETALEYAVGHCLVENVRALVKGHAGVNVRDAKGKTALALAKEGLTWHMETSFNHGSSEQEREEDWRQVVHLLKQAGAKE